MFRDATSGNGNRSNATFFNIVIAETLQIRIWNVFVCYVRWNRHSYQTVFNSLSWKLALRQIVNLEMQRTFYRKYNKKAKQFALSVKREFSFEIESCLRPLTGLLYIVCQFNLVKYRKRIVLLKINNMSRTNPNFTAVQPLSMSY